MDVTEPIEQVNEPTLPLPQEVTAPLLPEKPQQESDANASVGASIINMTNNVLGSGLVALAYSMKQVEIGLDVNLQCSLVPGIILLTLLAAIACFSQIIITRSCRITEKYTYKEM